MQTARRLAPSRQELFRSFDEAFLDVMARRALTAGSVAPRPVHAPKPANDTRPAPTPTPEASRLPVEDYMLSEAAWIRMHGL